jgi:hypothetical protein
MLYYLLLMQKVNGRHLLMEMYDVAYTKGFTIDSCDEIIQDNQKVYITKRGK